ncbi:hypothetical protein PVAP13_7KG024803 [Panicum virgatum]|uniref:Uncharacterized protein n=1 Tax=Panicum virgatum TaxID=38727 RepID=A0A8T0QDT5_PANVG|nr:hypothetical protein PVAP13_7KG024803 [Panicum virgatum]
MLGRGRERKVGAERGEDGASSGSTATWLRQGSGPAGVGGRRRRGGRVRERGRECTGRGRNEERRWRLRACGPARGRPRGRGAGPARRGGGPGGEGEEAGRAGPRGEERERAAQLRF